MTRHHRRDDGGAMAGGPPRAVWHTTEGGSTAGQFRNMTYPSHLVWQPRTGEIVQLVPAGRAGRALENDSGGPETNQEGRVCIQIEVVAEAAHPFTDGPMRNLDRILDWLDSWDIPRRFPSGRPGGVEMYGPNPQRSVRNWRTRAGHYGHSQVPENAHWDPGRIDIDALLGDDMPSADEVADKVVAKLLSHRMKPYAPDDGHESDGLRDVAYFIKAIHSNARRAYLHAMEDQVAEDAPVRVQLRQLAAAVEALRADTDLNAFREEFRQAIESIEVQLVTEDEPAT